LDSESSDDEDSISKLIDSADNLISGIDTDLANTNQDLAKPAAKMKIPNQGKKLFAEAKSD
jgi:hypothetical protein